MYVCKLGLSKVLTQTYFRFSAFPWQKGQKKATFSNGSMLLKSPLGDLGAIH